MTVSPTAALWSSHRQKATKVAGPGDGTPSELVGSTDAATWERAATKVSLIRRSIHNYSTNYIQKIHGCMVGSLACIICEYAVSRLIVTGTTGDITIIHDYFRDRAVHGDGKKKKSGTDHEE